jgi:hypothetical protein
LMGVRRAFRDDTGVDDAGVKAGNCAARPSNAAPQH